MNDEEYFLEKEHRWSIFNIMGYRVEVRRMEGNERVWFTAYVRLRNSKFLSDNFLSHPTLREGDVCGIDTAHSFNEDQSEAEKLSSALHQIETVIERYKEAMGDSE